MLALAGCSSSPTSPAPAPTATPLPVNSTPTATPTVIPGGSLTPTATPGGTTTYTVKYEFVASNTTWTHITYLSDSDSHGAEPGNGTWSETLTMTAGYKAEMVTAFTGSVPPASVTSTIYVNGTVVATESHTSPAPAFTISYWLP